MQTKDIPDKPILQFLENLGPVWATWFLGNYDNSVASVLPGVHHKLVLSKVRSMLKRGLIEGCGCGCRGDFRLTVKGRERLNMLKILRIEE